MASKSGQLPAMAAAAAALSAASDDDQDQDVVVMEEPEDSDAEEEAAASNMDSDDDNNNDGEDNDDDDDVEEDDDDDNDRDNENSDPDGDNDEEEDEEVMADADDDDDDEEEGSDIDDINEDDGDKKPAAKSSADLNSDDEEEDSSSEEEESDDDEDDDSSDDNGDDDDGNGGEEPSFVTVTDEFGNERTVSAYEAARIERIRRNKERLASLGLEGSSRDGRRGSASSGAGGGGTLLSAHTAEMERKKEERRRKREQRKRELAEMREGDCRSSSRKRKQVSYAEIKESGVDGRKSDGSGGRKSSSTSNREVSKWRTERPREQRVPLFIFKELRRVESDRKKNLKRAERNSRAADIEYRFAQKNAMRVEKAIRKREEMEHQRRQWLERQQEKKELQEFFRSIDDRKDDLIQARGAFDQERYVSSVGYGQTSKVAGLIIILLSASLLCTHFVPFRAHLYSSFFTMDCKPYLLIQNRPKCIGGRGTILTTTVPSTMR